MRYFCASDIIFSNSQPSLGTRSSNGSRKFLEIKVKKKRMTSNVRNGLKFGKICKKVILYTKMDIKWTNSYHNLMDISTEGVNLAIIMKTHRSLKMIPSIY